jgi:hypothetical protein
LVKEVLIQASESQQQTQNRKYKQIGNGPKNGPVLWILVNGPRNGTNKVVFEASQRADQL